jgi:hypothetical protein
MSKKTYRSVDELTRDELDELKYGLYCCLVDEGVCDYAYPDEIPDEIVKKNYAGVSFVEEDFFCNTH